MWRLSNPSPATLAAILQRQAGLPFTYPDVGATRGEMPAGYVHDVNTITLGHGDEVFTRACAALRAWRMFPPAWTRIEPAGAPQVAGADVVVLCRALGVWWLNGARVVYVVDQDARTAPDGAQRQGFAYGTLPTHVEVGEERFTVARLPDGTVQYELRAFSRPGYWAARCCKPLARLLQRRFVRDSQVAMLRAAAGAGPEPMT